MLLRKSEDLLKIVAIFTTRYSKMEDTHDSDKNSNIP